MTTHDTAGQGGLDPIGDRTLGELRARARDYWARERTASASALRADDDETQRSEAAAMARRAAMRAHMTEIPVWDPVMGWVLQSVPRDDRARAAVMSAAGTPEAQAMAAARADAREARAAKRKAARLALYARGGGAAETPEIRERVFVFIRSTLPLRRVWFVDSGGAAEASIAGAVTVINGVMVQGNGESIARRGAARASYVNWWHRADSDLLGATARRVSRSVRAGRVSSTSRDEAEAAARASLITDADRLVKGRGCDWTQAARAVSIVPHFAARAAAAARASLRGDGRGGMTGRDSELLGVATLTEQGNGKVWCVDSSKWITVKRRAEAGDLVDTLGRMMGEVPEADAARWAADAVRLVGWLARRRLGEIAGQHGRAFGGIVTQAQSAGRACVRARVRSSAARLARVLRGMARGESMQASVTLAGWSWDTARQRSDGYRRAVASLTAGSGLSEAWRDYRAAMHA